MMEKDKIFKNIFTGVGGQFIVLVLGIIVPRILLVNYGSDTNGLLSTITQIFTYMALLEAGVGQAARNLLYKPIAEKNQQEFSYVVSTAQHYFRKLTLIYAIGVFILSILGPILIKSNIDSTKISAIILLQGLAGVINFYYVETQTIILSADGHGYINNIVNTTIQIASYSAKIVMATIGLDIVALQVAFFLITICKSFFYKLYFKKRYSWIDYKAAPPTAKLKDRNSYIISELSWTLFSSTDMIVLSMFISTQMSSVYSVYNMVFTSINVLVNSVYSSLVYILGQTYHENIKQYEKLHDLFTSVFLGIVTILMSITYYLIIPFVKLYTSGINDVEYIYPLLPLLFCLVQIISWSRYITGNLTAVAGFAKQTGRVSFIEAATNVILSIVLVKKFGIVGVLFATVAALPIKVIYCTYLSDVKILKRSPFKTIKILLANYCLFAFLVYIKGLLNFSISSVLEFVKYGFLLTILIGVFGICVNLIVNKDCIMIGKLIKRRKGGE